MKVGDDVFNDRTKWNLPAATTGVMDDGGGGSCGLQPARRVTKNVSNEEAMSRW